MAHYNTVMNQLLDLVPRHEFERIVREHGGNRNEGFVSEPKYSSPCQV